MKRSAFAARQQAADGVGFFQAGAMSFAVWPADELAKDANAAAGPPPAFRGVALAWNCRSQAEVDAAIERARIAGAHACAKRRRKTFWGGYAGYFADPDGHLWEVAHNPGFPLTDDGRLSLARLSDLSPRHSQAVRSRLT